MIPYASTGTLLGAKRRVAEARIGPLGLVGLERKLQNELDEGPQPPPENGGGKRPRRQNGMNGQRFIKNADGEIPSASSR